MRVFSSKKIVFTLIFGVLFVLFLLPGFIMPGHAGSAGEAAAATAALAPASFADLAEKLMPAVVNIHTTRKVKVGGMGPFGQQMPNGGVPGRDEFFKRFFGNMPEREYKQNSLGSGFIISQDGYIFTNNHVIDKVDKIRVKLSSGKEYDAKVIGSDDKTDLALIKIDTPDKLPAVKLGDSDRLRIGDWVVAIGNPFGLDGTITAGIVSAKGRVIGAGPYDNFIQTDASINPGNSGGPLFNLSGEVVGINTAIIAQGQGIGFAVPINTAKGIFDDLKTRGKVTRGWLGISVQDLTPDIAKNLGIKEEKGVLVGDVFSGDPADKAGIKTGDVIVNINGKPIETSHDLMGIVATLTVGKPVEVKALRDGAVKTFMVVIAERKDTKETAQGEKREEGHFGLAVQDITPQIAQSLGLKDKSGVIVSDIEDDSPAAEAGIKTGDVITQVNKVRVKSVKEFTAAMAGLKKSDSVLLLIKRGDGSFFVTLKKD